MVIVKKHIRVIVIQILGVIALGFETRAIAEPGDETCFPLYRATGAQPGTVDCPFDAARAEVGLGNFFCTANTSTERIDRFCGSALKPTPCNDVGHPIDAGTGNKHLAERDFTGTGLFPLIFERYTNSSAFAAQGGSLGDVWRSTYDRKIQINSIKTRVNATRANGQVLYFHLSDNKWIADGDISDTLIQLKDAAGGLVGWRLTQASDDSTETYNETGRLIVLTHRNGQIQTLTLSTASTPVSIAPSPNLVISVTDQFGRQLGFTWDSQRRMSTLSDPQGNNFLYKYDSSSRLTTVTYPDAATPSPKRTYIYNEKEHTQGISLPNAITGIIDENNVRLATYDYDVQGRGIGTQYALGADKYTLTFGSNTTTVTDPINSARTYSFVKRLGAPRFAGSSQPAGAGCVASANTVTSTNSGNQAFTYDASGNRVAAVLGGTSYTNKISTTSNRLASTSGPAPAKINQYDAAGNLINDASISFTFNARGRRDSAVIGTDTVTYQYNGLGQRVLKSGPDPVVSTGQQQYVYDQAGHLIGEYDAGGTLIQETVYLGDIPVAVLKQNVDTSGRTPVTSTNVYYIYADQINTPRVITQASDNQIVWRWDAADPFGVQQPGEDPSGLGGFTYNPRFPGQLYDRETNLHYNGYRDYDPLEGRYTTSDPIGLGGGINTYFYV